MASERMDLSVMIWANIKSFENENAENLIAKY